MVFETDAILALRPRASTAYVGLTLDAFWHQVATDPTFPKPARVGRDVNFDRAELDVWIALKRELMRLRTCVSATGWHRIE